MACPNCDEHRKVSGKAQFDLMRSDSESQRYSAQFKVVICPSCGRTEFYCDFPTTACDWLSASASKKPKRPTN